MSPNKRRIAMTNLTRATQLSLATTLILGSSAIYADHGQRNNDVESLLLNVASAFLVTEAAQYSILDREQRSRHSRGYRRDRDNSGHSFVRQTIAILEQASPPNPLEVAALVERGPSKPVSK